MSIAQINSYRQQHEDRCKLIRITDASALSELPSILDAIPDYAVFKLTRDHAGHAMYFLGDGAIKGRNRGKCSKHRLGHVKAHTAIWFATDELEEKAFPIVDERCTWGVNTNVQA
jgi:hypothetical protein